MTALPKSTSICVCPIDGEGNSHTLHRNYLLPISNNLVQGECANSVEGDGLSDRPALIQHRSDASPADCLTWTQLKSRLNLLSEQSELFIPETTRSTGTDTIDKGLWGVSGAPILLKQSSSSMKNQLLMRYYNFELQQHNIILGTFNICVGLCVYSTYVMCVHCLLWEYSVKTPCEPPQICPTQMIPDINWDTIHVDSMVNFWMGGVDYKIFDLSAAAPPEKPKDNFP